MNILKKYMDYPIIQYSHRIKKQLNLMIEIFDTEDEYNSAGKPINIEIFQ